MFVSAAFPWKEQNVSPQKSKSFFLLLLTAVALVLWKQTLFPEGISLHQESRHSSSQYTGTWGQRLPGWWGWMRTTQKEAPPEGNAHLGSHTNVSGPFWWTRQKCRLLNVSVKCNLSQRKEPGIPCLLNFMLFLTLNRTLELRLR